MFYNMRPEMKILCFVFNLIALTILTTSFKLDDERPPYKEYAMRARYMVHRANWTVLSSFSAHAPTIGYPYARLESCADGLPSSGKGTPYFYLMESGTPAENFGKCNNVSVTYSEAQFPDILDCAITAKSDPENPLCSRLMLYGDMYVVTDAEEHKFAESALFTRHPFMKAYPPSHNFQVYGLNIRHISILDFYGGAVTIDVNDYYKA